MQRAADAEGQVVVSIRRSWRWAWLMWSGMLACAAAGDEGISIDGPGNGSSSLNPGSGQTPGFGDFVGNDGAAQDPSSANAAPDGAASCGDGLRSELEACDDGNSVSGDGCTGECDQLESGYVCSTPGAPCIYDVLCGDGLVFGVETCDDGPAGSGVSADGCSSSCEIEPGFVCPVLGAACRPVCGDGLVRGREACDPAAPVDFGADACDAACQLRPGWVCPPGSACRRTRCGDGVIEGSEQCDDGNARPYDGCSPSCVPEPRCGTAVSAVGPCASTCGDGIVLRSDDEACDDGNVTAGDGCDPSCQLEPGYDCTTTIDAPPPFVDIPVVLRDFPIFQSFQGPGETNPVGHPDMNRLCCALVPGIVQPLLGADRKPVYAGTGDVNPINQTSGQTYFDQWYRDVPGVNLRFDQTLRLLRQPSGAYGLNSAVDAPWAALGGFFPLDGLGFGAENLGHNFFFTSELRYWFEYGGGEQLDFSGDDDVWVFINGHLAVDLGGVHNRTFARVVLGADGTGLGCTGDGCAPTVRVDYEMQVGDIYEVVVLQAERHPGESNYLLTLANFLPGVSRCTPVCGDGTVTPDEACDLGSGNTGAHGGCNADCTLAPFCGDGVVATQFGEQCDDGVNASAYGGCAPGCVGGPGCGDGIVQSPFEQCDDGVNDGGYRECGPSCDYDERCGDGVVQRPFEECDPSSPDANGRCLSSCRLNELR